MECYDGKYFRKKKTLCNILRKIATDCRFASEHVTSRNVMVVFRLVKNINKIHRHF